MISQGVASAARRGLRRTSRPSRSASKLNDRLGVHEEMHGGKGGTGGTSVPGGDHRCAIWVSWPRKTHRRKRSAAKPGKELASAIVTRLGGDGRPARGKRRTAPRAQRVERGPTPAAGPRLRPRMNSGRGRETPRESSFVERGSYMPLSPGAWLGSGTNAPFLWFQATPRFCRELFGQVFPLLPGVPLAAMVAPDFASTVRLYAGPRPGSNASTLIVAPLPSTVTLP